MPQLAFLDEGQGSAIIVVVPECSSLYTVSSSGRNYRGALLTSLPILLSAISKGSRPEESIRSLLDCHETHAA